MKTSSLPLWCSLLALGALALPIQTLAQALDAPLTDIVGLNLSTRLKDWTSSEKLNVYFRTPNAGTIRYFGEKGYLPLPAPLDLKEATQGEFKGLMVEPRAEYFTNEAEFLKAQKYFKDGESKFTNDFYVDVKGLLRRFAVSADRKKYFPGEIKKLPHATKALLAEGLAFYSRLEIFGISNANGELVHLGRGNLWSDPGTFSQLSQLNEKLMGKKTAPWEWLVQTPCEMDLVKQKTELRGPTESVLSLYANGKLRSFKALEAFNILKD